MTCSLFCIIVSPCINICVLMMTIFKLISIVSFIDGDKILLTHESLLEYYIFVGIALYEAAAIVTTKHKLIG